MIERILDLENQIIKVDKLEEMTLDELRTIREEIRLISNKTPAFIVVEGSLGNYRGEDESKVIGFDSLWAHVNISIEKKKREDHVQIMSQNKVYNKGLSSSDNYSEIN